MDFGFVKPKELSKASIKIKNLSDKPLTILAVQPSCKCTSLSDLAGHEIPPQGFVMLDAALKNQSSPGVKKATIKVLIDGYSRVSMVELKAEATLAIRALPGHINAVRGEAMSGRIVVSSLDGKPFSIISAHGAKPSFVGFDPAADAPLNRYLLNYDLTQFTKETMPRYWIIETDRAECPVLDVVVRHEWTLSGAFKFALKPTDMRRNLGKLVEGQPHEFEMEFESVTAADPLITVASSNPAVHVVLGEARYGPNEEQKEVCTVKVKLTPKEGHQGLFYGNLTFYTSNKEQTITVFGRIFGPGK